MMNLYEVFNDKNQVLLKEAGISLENKEYSYEECKFVFYNVMDYIMSHSKNEIQDISCKYNVITGVFERYFSKIQ